MAVISIFTLPSIPPVSSASNSKKAMLMNKQFIALLSVTMALQHARAISLDDIQLWTGAGSNRAALVIEWNSPEVFNNTTVPAPIANKTMVWGYQFNGTATGSQMLDAILASDPRFYAVINTAKYGETIVEGLGYNLNNNGVFGVTDGTNTYNASAFTNGVLLNSSLGVDAASPLNSGDLYWSGWWGPNWNVWNELGDSGGFTNSPNRGTSQYWNASTWTQGQWESASAGLDDLPLQNGSWIGFSVGAAGYDANTNDAAYAACNLDEQAPPSPDGTYTAYICNTNDFAVQIISTNTSDPRWMYDDPMAVLGGPTLNFLDYLLTDQVHRTKIVEAPYWTAPDGVTPVITAISSGGQITVDMGRKIYDDPNNPHGVDLIVFGDSYFVGAGDVDDSTDLDSYDLSGGICAHPTTVSVSQDGTNWYAYNTVTAPFPQNAYRWDETNHSWTDEQLNPTKPLNPSVYTMAFDNQPASIALRQFIGSAGGTGYDLKESGFPWIQYVQIQPGAGTFTVIDAIAAVNPAVVGDALSITPDNLASGITNLAFQNPAQSSQNLISINFDSISDIAKVSTVGLSEFSSFAPVVGNVSSAYQITLKPVTDGYAVTFVADIGLRAGTNYAGTGSDLRVYQWKGTHWTSQPFKFNPANKEVLVAGITNFSAFVVTQIVPPQLRVQTIADGLAFQFTPVANSAHILERSTNLLTWTAIATNTPASAKPVTLCDTNAPARCAFYRLLLNIP